MLPRAEWLRIQDELNKVNKDKESIREAAKQREALHRQSKEVVKKWSNTIAVSCLNSAVTYTMCDLLSKTVLCSARVVNAFAVPLCANKENIKTNILWGADPTFGACAFQ